MRESINSPVYITAVGFGNGMQAYPKRMEWQGKTFCFIDKGIRATIRRGENTMSTVTMSDGKQNFCLRQTGGIWMLLGIC